jgi:solute carrier family 25 (mitochondrial adenine nucleotide translocator), member 4/5/6/31
MSTPSPPKIKKSFWIDFTLGGVSAAVAKTLCAPIERVKLILQNRPEHSKSVGQCFRNVYKDQGLYSFWRGNLANVLRYFPTQALNFAFKDFYKRRFNPYNPKTDPVKFFFGNMLAGGLAGSSSLAFVYSLDFARTRLAADMGKEGAEREFKGLIDVLWKTFRKDGIVGLYRGFVISVMGIFVYRACYFGFFDTGRTLLFKGKDPGFLLMWAYAQTITIVASTACYPIDTIRRRMMMQSGKAQFDYTTSWGCFRYLLKKEGPKGFYNGCLANVYRATAGALVLVFYSKLEKWLGLV